MKKKLATGDMLTYFTVIDHCNERILVDQKSLNNFTEITCPGCDEPLMFRCSNGLWYMAGGRIFQ